MRSFLTSSAVFLSIAVLIGIGLGRVSRSLAPPYAMKEQRIALFEERAPELEVVGVGASHGTSLDYPSMGVDGFHFWTLGEDAFETEAILRAYLPRLPKVHTLFLPIAAGTFWVDNAIEVTDDRSQHRRIYYATHPGWRILGGDYENFVGGKLSGIVRLDHWKGVFRVAKRRYIDGETVQRTQGRVKEVTPDGFMVRMVEVKSLSREEHARDAAQQLERQRVLRDEMLAGDPHLPQRVYDALVGCLELARAHDVRLILLSTPVLDVYREGIPEDAMAHFRRQVERLVEEEGAEYHDFMADPVFSQNPDHFFNADHMNRVGARAFSAARLRPLLETRP